MDLKIIQEVKDQIMSEALEDEIGLWWLYGQAKDRFPPDLVKAACLQVIAECLKGGLRAGQYEEGSDTWDFHAWDMSDDMIIRNIQSQWDKLGREPDLRDNIYLVVPPARTYRRHPHSVG